MISNTALTLTNRRGNKLARLFECSTSSIHYLSILEGNTRGEVYVDNPASPKLAIIYSYLLGGFQVMGKPPVTPEQYAGLRLALQNDIIPKLLKPNNIPDFSYSCDTDALLEMMRIIYFDKETFEQTQLTYKYDHRAAPVCFPKTSYEVIRINADFAQSNEDFNKHYRGEILETYKSMDVFLNGGIGYIALDGDMVIGNLLSNGKYKNSYILGADTRSEYRNRGIASTLLLSAVSDANKNGYDLVWECTESNIASINTVEKCGFSKLGSFRVRWFEI